MILKTLFLLLSGILISATFFFHIISGFSIWEEIDAAIIGGFLILWALIRILESKNITPKMILALLVAGIALAKKKNFQEEIDMAHNEFETGDRIRLKKDFFSDEHWLNIPKFNIKKGNEGTVKAIYHTGDNGAVIYAKFTDGGMTANVMVISEQVEKI